MRVIEDRLRRVENRKKYEFCWRCRKPFSFEDLHYTGIGADGNWRFECVFCQAENKYGHLTAYERIAAHTLSRQRLFKALVGDEIT